MYHKNKICIIGQGYVGLPLANEFSKKFKTLGFDINKKRINDLKNGFDKENILKKKFLNKNLEFSYNKNLLKKFNIFIIAVPTPITSSKKPNLKKLIQATKMVASILKHRDLVIFESTVYPGTTEEICIPILKKKSNLNLLTDIHKERKNFFECGYSPERVNPGDKNKTINKITKVISGSSKQTLKKMNYLYRFVTKAGIYRAKSIKIAEAAKIIENIQRDINIALINEFSLLFKKANLNIRDILDVALSKWNFLDFKPGLVGGHCIGVDPYYLTHMAKKIGYKPKLLLAGRKINDDIIQFVSKDIIKLIKRKNKVKKKIKILIFGFAFKENVSDIRNTKILELIMFLNKENFFINVFDPLVNVTNIKLNKKINFLKKINFKIKYDAIINAVNHDNFKNYNYKKIKKLLKKGGIIYDLKDKFPRNLVHGGI